MCCFRFCSAMACSSPCTLVLCGKSMAENEIAESLKKNNTLMLPDNDVVSILLHSEADKPFNEESFGIDSFMNSLSTNRFGRFLLWSPRLTSTHDVVSQYVSQCLVSLPFGFLILLFLCWKVNVLLVMHRNFGELPIGSICVADVQYKGRGSIIPTDYSL